MKHDSPEEQARLFTWQMVCDPKKCILVQAQLNHASWCGFPDDRMMLGKTLMNCNNSSVTDFPTGILISVFRVTKGRIKASMPDSRMLQLLSATSPFEMTCKDIFHGYFQALSCSRDNIHQVYSTVFSCSIFSQYAQWSEHEDCSPVLF